MHKAFPFAPSPVMVQLRRCEFISVAEDWRASLIPCHSSALMGTSLSSGLSSSLPPPPDRQLLCSITPHLPPPPTVISCQLTGKRPIYKFNTRSWHLSCGCQARQTCTWRKRARKCYGIDFLKANWNIYTNLSQLARHWINAACFLLREQIC